MRKTIIYELAHVYETESGEDEEKGLGSYSSRENALAAIERYKKLPGFCRLPDAFVIRETTLDHDAAWTDGFFSAYPYFAVVYKIVPRAEWEMQSGDYHGSAQDKADGFIHFSSIAQIPETLERHFANHDDLILVAVRTQALGPALKWEPSKSRDEEFPHLYGVLPCDAMIWARPIAKDADGKFALPNLT